MNPDAVPYVPRQSRGVHNTEEGSVEFQRLERVLIVLRPRASRGYQPLNIGDAENLLSSFSTAWIRESMGQPDGRVHRSKYLRPVDPWGFEWKTIGPSRRPRLAVSGLSVPDGPSETPLLTVSTAGAGWKSWTHGWTWWTMVGSLQFFILPLPLGRDGDFSSIQSEAKPSYAQRGVVSHSLSLRPAMRERGEGWPWNRLVVGICDSNRRVQIRCFFDVAVLGSMRDALGGQSCRDSPAASLQQVGDEGGARRRRGRELGERRAEVSSASISVEVGIMSRPRQDAGASVQ